MAGSELSIQNLGPKGDGISVGSRGRIYVDRAVPGDRVRARLYRDAHGLARADIKEILRRSPFRQKPPCPHYDRCGNCTLQHLEPSYYRSWKLQLVKEAFQNQGLRPRHWREPLFLGAGNRRRVTFSVYRQKKALVMGYFLRRSQHITDIPSCLIADPRLLELRERMKPVLGAFLPEGRRVDVFFQIVGNAVDVLGTGPIGKKGVPEEKFVKALAESLEGSSLARISWRREESDRPQVLLSKGPFVARFADLAVELPPDAFLQPTAEGENALAQILLAGVPEKGRFADLFSGCGTFSGPLLKKGSVDAYEESLPAVKALSKAAGSLPLKVFRRDLFRNPLRREELNRYDAVVFDPPRAGCREQAEAMASARVRVLIGVSCNPATFARDASHLVKGGYRLHSLQVVDQFLWSHHVEVVGVFLK